MDATKIPPSTLPETLALGGAVYKRKWENDGQVENLYQALIFYRGAWQFQPKDKDSGKEAGYGDMGYGG